VDEINGRIFNRDEEDKEDKEGKSKENRVKTKKIFYFSSLLIIFIPVKYFLFYS